MWLSATIIRQFDRNFAAAAADVIKQAGTSDGTAQAYIDITELPPAHMSPH